MEDKRRYLFLLVFFTALFLAVILRLFSLQILQGAFYERKSLEQRTRLIELAARRGDISDRNGELLATSIDSYSVYEYKKGWVGRKLDFSEAQKLKEQAPKTRGILTEKKRVYPKSHLAAQTIGFVGIDNRGLAGIEMAYDEFLAGKCGKVITEGDPQGKELYGAVRELEPGMDGMNVTLTIDASIQYIAEREIERQIKASKARAGMCIVMDIESGEILALASKPDFDPNDYLRFDRSLWHPRVNDPYEPGSTFKIVTVAAALEAGVIAPDSMLDALDTIVVGGRTIKNSRPIDWPGKKITLSKMLEDSINTATVQIGLKMGPENFYNYLRLFGFGRRTEFGLRGESAGILRHWKNWYKPDIAMITFGQSIAVTPVQLIAAAAALARDGSLPAPRLVKKIESIDGKYFRVFSPEITGRPVGEAAAAQTRELMRNVVVRGGGRRAAVDSFGVFGKTGTAQKAVTGGRGYYKDKYISSFIGFAPYANPRIAALVIIDDPRGVYWGEAVCGPVFQRVVDFTLRYMNVAPDML